MLSLRLLGQVQVTRDAAKVARFRSQTELALLVYLAHSGQTHTRESLADLLWEARSTKQSLSNLRTTLTRLRSKVGDELLVTRKTLAFVSETDAEVDSLRFRQRLKALTIVDSAENAADLWEALSIYQGDFLTDLYLPEATRFNDWVAVERERLRQTLFSGFDRLLRYASATGDLALGIDVATRWLSFDNLDEYAHRQLIQMLAMSGRRAAALAHHAQFKALLASELGVVPQSKTQQLAAAIRLGQFDAPVEAVKLASAVANNLPRELTTFFGRTQEINGISERLLDPTHPLITLTGEGGMGKTRLSLAIARQLLTKSHPFTQGIFFISLADIQLNEPDDTREAVSTAIAQAIGMLFHGKRQPAEQLIGYLQERACLLVLDNFEPLVDSGAVDLILDLLKNAPQTKLLVTSRAALDLNSETVIRLRGLPAPEHDVAQSSVELLQPESASYDSVRLFADRAARKASEFRLAAQLPSVITICQLLDGLPLAIELAAASVAQIACAEIAAELAAGIALLSTRKRDIPARQRSMRAVFDYSWRLLAPSEQELMARLAVFNGGFARDAATVVLPALAARLDGLERHSLLRRDDAGRYSMHPLLRGFSAEKQQAFPQAPDIASRHAEHYLTQVSLIDSNEAGELERLNSAEIDQANIRQAWRWASEQEQGDLIAKSQWGLSTFFDRRGLFQEGEAVFQASIAQLRQAGSANLAPLVASLHTIHGHFFNRLGRYADAMLAAERALELSISATSIDSASATEVRARAQLVWGTALYRTSQFDAALERFEDGLVAARQMQLRHIEAALHRVIGTVMLDQSKYAKAHEYDNAALVIFRELGNKLGEANCLTNLGWLSQIEGKLDAALAYDRQAYDLHLSIENPHGASIALINMGLVQGMQGAFSQSYRSRLRVLDFLEKIDDRYQRSLVTHGLGVLLSRMGQYDEALGYYERALRGDREMGDIAGTVWTSLNVGLLHNHRDEFAKALAIHLDTLATSRELGTGLTEGLSLLRLGQDYAGLGQQNEAAQSFTAAHLLFEEVGQLVWRVEALAGLAVVQLKLGKRAAALESVDAVLAHLADKPLGGAREPLLVHWNCYQVLLACGDARADGVLSSAEILLNQTASQIEHPAQRHSYLHNIRTHRALRQAFATRTA